MNFNEYIFISQHINILGIPKTLFFVTGNNILPPSIEDIWTWSQTLCKPKKYFWFTSVIWHYNINNSLYLNQSVLKAFLG